MSGIIPASVIGEQVLALYDSGGLKAGTPTGWPSVTKLFTVAPCMWTVITGEPGSGKSTWLDAMLVNLAGQGDWTFAFYSPEQYPEAAHFSKIAQQYLGSPFCRGPTERMSREQLVEAMDWVNEYFMWLTPEKKDFMSLLETAQNYRCANKNFGLVIDPWNQIEHTMRPNGMSETEYIGRSLSILTNWTRQHKMHTFVVAHPTKLAREKNGDRTVPHPYDIAGSANWFNKADACITVHRPLLPGETAKGSETLQDVDIYVKKIRFSHIGELGLVTLRFDKTTRRYHELPQLSVVPPPRPYVDI